MPLVKKILSHLEYLAAEKPVVLAGWTVLTAAIVVIGFSLPYWTRDFWGFLENVAVEAHGMIFDLLVIGWLILWLNKRAEKRLDNRRYQEEIDDYRHWREVEASHRIAGNIKRLNKNGVIRRINLADCYLYESSLESASLIAANLEKAILARSQLSSAHLNNACLVSADLTSANLFNASLVRSDLSGANLNRTRLVNSDLSQSIMFKVNLRGAELGGADLTDAILFKANLGYAELTDTIFNGTLLIGSDLRDSTGLTIAQLTSSNPPLLFATQLPAGMEHLPNCDAAQISQALLSKRPDLFKTLEEARQQVDTVLSTS